MYTIDVSNRQSLIDISDADISSIVSDVLKCEEVQSAEVVVALVDDATIHEVNREHLQHDYPTDVISFLYDAEEPVLDGELVVSTETAVRAAQSYGWSPVDELRLYIAHGLLHLCGYDDLSDDEQAIMRDRERAVLKIWSLVPHYD
ncbi:UNVERIFIED_CONTAM: hypothetical protein GTU68_012164 [Idotea baltica]|nr:hypothetical protein [Idotea baltica]